ncbi:CoB--CoM heterodisulfide reductase iron-sulfur subunit A family protein [bacterium]|nr:CoB--CoM heterodisulfide reductase iron-sulfur subunit A family protein [bacterium]
MTEDKSQHNGEGADAENIRVGVYICHCGGNISDTVEIERVVEAAAKMPSVVVARRNMFMCSDPGQSMIEEDIRTERLNRVVVGACSPSLHELTFRGVLTRAGINPYLFENANLREQVSWVSKGDPTGATDKAIRLVGAAVAKARLLRPLEPIRLEATPRVVVIGGGLTGLRCALDLARLDLDVTLLEEQPFLGGHLAELGQVYPSDKPAREILGELIREVSAHPRICILTSAEVIEASGCVGTFLLKVRAAGEMETQCFSAERIAADLASRAHGPNGDHHNDGAGTTELEIQAGMAVLATGFDHYTPSQGEYGYEEHPGIITLPALIRELESGGLGSGPPALNGRPINSIGFIHCVGSRELDGVHDQNGKTELNHYCSRVCCTSALWAAKQLQARYPDLQIYDFHKDIRTYGHGHEDIYEDTAKSGVIFCRFADTAPPKVTVTESDPPLMISLKDELTFNEEIDVPVDLVVLVTGMVPHAIDNLVDMLKLPRSADRFLQEVHPKLRPVEMAVNGVLIAGCCQAPLDSVESAAAASAAAAKAAALLGKGYIEREPFVARVDQALCNGTSACVEECKYNQAVSLVETAGGARKAQVNAAICCGCGMCAAVCPTGAIQVDGWRLDQFDAMIDALLVNY